MSLIQEVKSDKIAAMKAKDKETLSVLRVLEGELVTNSTRPEKDKLDELSIVRKMSKNATDLGETGEVKVLAKYLPQMLDETQLETVVSGVITANEFSTMKDMGKVMGELKKLECSSQIDNKIASGIVRRLLG